MRKTPTKGEDPLDIPLLALFNLGWETAAYILLIALAIFTRFWNLGARTIAHDESLHALYSWKLYAGEGYQHTPMMHGPFLFHANALVYFLFGANDYTARLVPAIFGVAAVALPYLLRKWLGRAGALITSTLILISPSLLYYSRYIRNDIYIVVWTLLMIIAMFKYIDERKNGWLYLGAASFSLSLCTKEVTYIFGFIVGTFVLLAVLWERVEGRGAKLLRAVEMAVAISAGLSALLIAKTGVMRALMPYLILLAGFALAALAIGRLIRGRSLLPALRSITPQAAILSLVIAVIIFVLLFTTFFTNLAGLFTGTVYTISYWLAQHGVQRGGQPWYYYIFLLLPLYEFLPFLLSLMGTAYCLIKGPKSNVQGQPRTSSFQPPTSNPQLFDSFLIYWLTGTILLYSWAGEKMPWLVVHLVLPMILLSGRFVGDVLEKADWRKIQRRGGATFALLLPLILFAGSTLVRVRPFQGMSIFKLHATMQWLGALAIVLILGYFFIRYLRSLGAKHSLLVAFVTALVFLGLLTIRFSWMASFINYDNVKEFLVYAHGAPDVKMAMREIEEISRRTVGDKQIKVAYDDDSTWPFEWYLRDYPKRVYYGSQPTKKALDAPIVIVGPKNEQKVKPFLGDRYYRFNYRLVWWPIEDYKGLTPRKLLSWLRDPAQRHKWWNIIFHRRYETPLTEWPYRHPFYFYVRKDVAVKLWDYRAGPVPPEELMGPYAKGKMKVDSILSWGSRGSGPGQFIDPRGLAVDREGNVYVADGGNHRIQKFDPNGRFLLQWGGQGNAPGQFQEPWGIAVDKDGNVYVADTWNHRIQKFDPNGRFLIQWGTYGNTQGTLGPSDVFWGPRDIAIDEEGNLYVTDTGNKRVMKFTPDGGFLGQWGGLGKEVGEFDEPVGIAIDEKGCIYVADTWNRRIQKFDENFNFLAEWPIHGWESTSVVNKPYLAAGKGRVYATDPEGYRVLVFDEEGKFVATFGEYGLDASSFALPIGVDIDAEGNIYVVDSGNNRVMKFAPLGR